MSDTKHIDDGGPALPTVIVHWNGAMIDRGPGMSLRDWFAGQAMAAMLSTYRNTLLGSRNPDDGDDSDVSSFGRDLAIDPNHLTGEDHGCNEIASDAYRFADAMLAARKGGEE